MNIELNDPQLVQRTLARDGDSAGAEEALYSKYRQVVSRIATSFNELDPDEAEDVVQDAFVRAFLALASLKDPARFPVWLSAIARNCAASYLTSRGVRRRTAQEASRESSAVSPAPAVLELLEREDVLRAVHSVIDDLSEGPEKETVRLFYVDGRLSAREIAEHLGVGKSAVTMRLDRFRARVKRRLVALCE